MNLTTKSVYFDESAHSEILPSTTADPKHCRFTIDRLRIRAELQRARIRRLTEDKARLLELLRQEEDQCRGVIAEGLELGGFGRCARINVQTSNTFFNGNRVNKATLLFLKQLQQAYARQNRANRTHHRKCLEGAKQLAELVSVLEQQENKLTSQARQQHISLSNLKLQLVRESGVLTSEQAPKRVRSESAAEGAGGRAGARAGCGD